MMVETFDRQRGIECGQDLKAQFVGFEQVTKALEGGGASVPGRPVSLSHQS